MAYTYSVNNAPATGAVAMYQLIAGLVAAGWVKKADSDGTVYSATGVQVTSGASGTNGLGNNSAWVRLQAPAVNQGTVANQTREITIQRGTSDLLWRIKYGASALFTGGSPAATVTPSSTDEVFMAGGGTDAAPTFLSWFTTNATYRWHIIAGGSAEFYSFVAFALTLGSTTGLNAIALDAMATGSYPAATDVDPAVMYCSTAAASGISEIVSSSAPTANVTNPALARAWLGATSAAGAAIVSTNSQNVRMLAMGSTNAFGGANTFGNNAWTNKEDLLFALWVGKGAAGPKGVKGISTLFQLGGLNHTNMTTCDISSSKDRIMFGNMWLPWNGSQPGI